MKFDKLESLNMDFEEVNQDGDDVEIICDYKNSGNLRGALSRAMIDITESEEWICGSKPDKDVLNDICRFQALSVLKVDVIRAFDDAVQELRPKRNK